jgi:hypothetical protein
MNSSPLNIRIPFLLKERLISDAKNTELSMSDFVREILIERYGGIKNGYEGDYPRFSNNDQFFNSSRFIFLIYWMQEKRINKYDKNTLPIIKFLKETVLKAMKDIDTPYWLQKEFEKVFIDLDRYIKDFKNKDKYFWFCIPGYITSFNYEILLEHVISKGTENYCF